jgi:hypothetical protein
MHISHSYQFQSCGVKNNNNNINMKLNKSKLVISKIWRNIQYIKMIF